MQFYIAFHEATRWFNVTLTRRIDGHQGNNCLGDLAMLPEHRALLEDEPCPVSDEILGEMYRASAHGLNELIATVSPTAESLACRVLLPSRPPCVDRTSDCGNVRQR